MQSTLIVGYNELSHFQGEGRLKVEALISDYLNDMRQDLQSDIMDELLKVDEFAELPESLLRDAADNLLTTIALLNLRS